MPTTLLHAFLQAFHAMATPTNVVLLLLATALGTFVGMLPGLGGTVTIALLIPLTFGMDPLTAFMVLVAANGGVYQGGSVTAILLNTPGSAPNAATILDGYPLARQGRAGEAIGISATASCLGALTGLAVLVLAIPFMLKFVLLFGSPEIFWLGIWGLTLLAVVVSGDVVSGLVSAGIGLLFSMHGINNLTALARWDYGLTFMLDGFKLVPLLIGLFAIAEMISLVSEGGQIAYDTQSEAEGNTMQGRFTGVKDVFIHWKLFLRSALLGTFIGAIPGIGGTAANYVAYFQAVQTSSHPERFGTGDVRGVIASEASNDGKEGGAYIPTLGFGVPGSASMAVLFGAFVLHGITPGPLLMQNHLDIVGVVVLAVLVSSILSSLYVYLAANQLIKLTRIDVTTLAPMVMAVAFLGSYALSNNPSNLILTAFGGLLGFVMMKINMSRVPLILGLVLGPIVEQQFFRALQISGNHYGYFLHSPIDWILIALIVVGLSLPYLRPYLARKGVLQ